MENANENEGVIFSLLERELLCQWWSPQRTGARKKEE